MYEGAANGHEQKSGSEEVETALLRESREQMGREGKKEQQKERHKETQKTRERTTNARKTQREHCRKLTATSSVLPCS